MHHCKALRSWLVVLGLVLCFLGYAQPASAHDINEDPSTPGRDRGNGVAMTLEVDRAPHAGEIATLTLTASPLFDAPELTVEWILPDGVELLGGPAVDRFASVAAQSPILGVRQVRFHQDGVFRVAVNVTYKPTPSIQLAEARVLYFVVGASPRISLIDPELKSPMGSIMQMIEVETNEAISAAQTNEDPCFEVSGNVKRIERTPTSTGYADPVFVPVRFARIEIREEDTFFDDSYDEGVTDANGNYSFEFCDNDGLFDDTLEVYIRLYSDVYGSTAEDAHRVAYVEDSSYIDEIYYYDSPQIVSSSGGSFTRNFELDTTQSGIFNIADSILDAWNVWNAAGGDVDDTDTYDYTAEVHWEVGYLDGGSYRNTEFDEITIASVNTAINGPDEWDDSVIIHEYGHEIEDNYGCDDSPGGPHNFGQILGDDELAWAEGYQDYFQAAVRQATGQPEPDVYIDVNGAGGVTAIFLETRDTGRPALRSPFNEMAIAAMFWDFMDGAVDGQDTVQHGHAMIQEVYTHYDFADAGVFDSECTVNQYLAVWAALGKPTDTATAAVAVQNVLISNPFPAVAAAADVAAESSTGDASGLSLPVSSAATAATGSNDYQWWQHLILVADRSNSMAGTKFTDVKTIMSEQVTDAATNPKGVEFSLYTFDNTSFSNQTVTEAKFFANLVTPSIDALTTNATADGNCTVDALRALGSAVGPKTKGNAWLFTDGELSGIPAVDSLVGQLNSRQIHGSIALLGGCSSVPLKPTETTGATQNYLGNAANSTQPAGIVPYLLTAIGTGGQFLYVSADKIDDAAEILRAQLSHSAGAGRWSDYVSDNPTYLYDKLTSWEYNWIDTSPGAGGVNQGIPNPQVSVQLPQPFSFYGSQQNTAHVTRYGYLTFGAQAQTAQANNTAIPAAAAPNNALYVLWEDLFWNNPPAAAAAQPDAAAQPNAADALQVNVFTRQDGDWYAIETSGDGGTQGEQRAYQILLNATTGEIRYQYQSMVGNSGGATIGLENAVGTSAVQVAFNDVNAAVPNTGYKFTPAPAQPSKTFTVSVDGLMTSVGFLLTGFSGSFDPLDVRYPDNSQVSCADTANVTCLNLGLVQYVQAKVNGRSGNWKASVSAGQTGAGTFTFSSIGASTVNASAAGPRALSTGAQNFTLNLGRAVTGNGLDGWFTRPNGQPYGAAFRFYDDGNHNDGRAGDGRFGSDNFTPGTLGVAYLWVRGNADGVDFTRSDLTPFNFQPLTVTSLGDGVNYGDITPLTFEIRNLDSVRHCYDRNTVVPQGWLYDWKFTPSEFLLGVCIDPGQAVLRTVEIKMAAVSPNTLPSGATGEVTVTFVEKEAGQISDSATAQVTRRRLPGELQIINKYASSYLPPTGVATATLTVLVFDDQSVSVADGVAIELSSSLGSLAPNPSLTKDGRVDPVFTAGTVEGTAVITAVYDSLVATTTLVIHAPLPETLALALNKTTLPAAENEVALTATVLDQWGSPLVNQTVRLGVSGDGEMGTIGGSDVFTGTTNASGQLTATYTRGNGSGAVVVMAQVIADENGTPHVALEEQKTIQVEALPTQSIYLPVVVR